MNCFVLERTAISACKNAFVLTLQQTVQELWYNEWIFLRGVSV